MKGFTSKQVPDQQGKTFFITGANAGIGFETAKVLAQRHARVLIGCRSREKAAAAIERIITDCPGANVDFVPLDLSDLNSIEAAAETLRNEPRLDALVNNAGIMTPPLEHTAQGFESQLGVNHLGPFVLTKLLIDKLEATPGARVINTSSLAHRSGKIHFDDINAKQGYSTTARYSQSKLANLLFSYELQRRLDKHGYQTRSIACHPGIADTELSRHLPKAFQLITPLVRILFNTPAQGAWPTLMAATANNLKGGSYCGPGRFRETSGPAKLVSGQGISGDEGLAERLWRLSEDMTGHTFLREKANKK